MCIRLLIVAVVAALLIGKGKGAAVSPPPAGSNSGQIVRLNPVVDFAIAHDIDPRVVAAVIQVESSWNPKARGSSGEVGLMQLMAGTAKELGVINREDPIDNIKGGIRYLAKCKKLRGDKYLRCFNGGPGGVNLPQTAVYEKKVLALVQ